MEIIQFIDTKTNLAANCANFHNFVYHYFCLQCILNRRVFQFLLNKDGRMLLQKQLTAFRG